MGLDTSHDAFHGGYGSFSIMRATLCLADGMTIEGGYAGTYTWPGEPTALSPDIDARCELGEVDRDEFPWDPLIFLIRHQDCDGVIKPGMAAALADRIEEVLFKVDAETEKFAPAWAIPAEPNTTALAKQFMEGLRRSSAAGEDLEFG